MNISYFRENPVQYSGFVIGVERMADIEPEIRAMHLVHWAETEVLYLRRSPDVDYPRLIALEKLNCMVLFTVRDNAGNLVGNLMYYLGPSTHFKGTQMATEDSFFLAQEARKGRLAIKLVGYAEGVLKKMGVGMVGMSDKAPCGGKSLARMMGMLDYQPVATIYIKELQENADVLPETT
jgi:hypothetical protein